MSYLNDVQECYMTINKRRTNSLLNKNQYKNYKNPSKYLSLDISENKNNKYKTKTFANNMKKINFCKSYSNFGKYNLNIDDKQNIENNGEYFKNSKIGFVPKINRHKRNLEKFININKEEEVKTKTKEKDNNMMNRTYNNFNNFCKRKRRFSAQLNNNNNKNKYIYSNQNDSDIIMKRIKHSSTNADFSTTQDTERIKNYTYYKEPKYSLCKNCFDRKMLEEHTPSFQNDNKEKLVEQFIKENPFYFVDKMNNYEKQRIQSKVDDISYLQRSVLPAYEREVNKETNLKKEMLQLVNEYSLNPLAIQHGKDPKYLEHKIYFDRKEKIIHNNPDIYKGLGQRKAYQDYYEKCMYQIPIYEEIYSMNPVYKKNYIKTLKKQIDDKQKKEKENVLKTKKAENLANKEFNDYRRKEKMKDLQRASYCLQVLNKDNKKLEEYKKNQKENKKKEEEKYIYKLNLLKDKENQEYKKRYRYEKIMDCEIYQKMYDEMNKKKEMKLFNKNEEKKKWNNYLDRFNIRYGYKNRYINCDLCNRPIQNPKKQIKKYPPSEDDFVNFNY